jgi:hypothetical protein
MRRQRAREHEEKIQAEAMGGMGTRPPPPSEHPSQDEPDVSFRHFYEALRNHLKLNVGTGEGGVRESDMRLIFEYYFPDVHMAGKEEEDEEGGVREGKGKGKAFGAMRVGANELFSTQPGLDKDDARGGSDGSNSGALTLTRRVAELIARIRAMAMAASSSAAAPAPAPGPAGASLRHGDSTGTGAHAYQVLRSALVNYDTDGDGRLSASELASALRGYVQAGRARQSNGSVRRHGVQCAPGPLDCGRSAGGAGSSGNSIAGGQRAASAIGQRNRGEGAGWREGGHGHQRGHEARQAEHGELWEVDRYGRQIKAACNSGGGGGGGYGGGGGRANRHSHGRSSSSSSDGGSSSSSSRYSRIPTAGKPTAKAEAFSGEGPWFVVQTPSWVYGDDSGQGQGHAAARDRREWGDGFTPGDGAMLYEAALEQERRDDEEERERRNRAQRRRQQSQSQSQQGSQGAGSMLGGGSEAALSTSSSAGSGSAQRSADGKQGGGPRKPNYYYDTIGVRKSGIFYDQEYALDPKWQGNTHDRHAREQLQLLKEEGGGGKEGGDRQRVQTRRGVSLHSVLKLLCPPGTIPAPATKQRVPLPEGWTA